MRIDGPVDEKTDVKKCGKSLVKLLIAKFESINVEDESSKNFVQCIQSVQNMETECGPGGVVESCVGGEE